MAKGIKNGWSGEIYNDISTNVYVVQAEEKTIGDNSIFLKTEES